MFCPNQVNNKALRSMRLELLERQKHVQHYKRLYGAECKSVAKLKSRLISMQKDYSNLQEDFENLKTKLIFLQTEDAKRQPRSKKQWQNINSDRTKCRRLACFKDLLRDTFRSMQVCHRAEVSFWLDTNRIHFSFSPSDFNEDSNDPKRTNHQNAQWPSDHSYATEDRDFTDNDQFQDLDYSEIYDCSGQWKKEHLRKLIYVMDSFRISHEAYHELRLVSKGYLPPIGRLSKEKKLMSEEIPYEKHPKVSFLPIFFHHTKTC